MKKSYVVLSVLALGACMTVTAAQADLVSRYTFDEGSGSTAYNSVGGAPNGAVNGGAAYVAGKVGTGALSFNGSGQYVDCSVNGLPTGAGLSTGSVALWVKTTNTASKQCILGAASTSNGSTGAQALDIDTMAGGGLELYLQADNVVPGHAETLTADASAPAALFNGAWHHLAMTWNATTGAAGSGSANMYVDGVPLTVTLNSNAILSSDSFAAWNNPMRIAINGRANPPTWDPFAGSLDNVSVYSTVLSPGEVAGLAGVPEPSALTLMVVGSLSLLAYAWQKRR